MARKIFTIILIGILGCGNLQPQESDRIAKVIEHITWFGQAAIRIESENLTIYIDPYQIQESDSADIILITHSHRDHLDPESIARIRQANTIIIGPRSCRKELEALEASQLILMAAGEEQEVLGIPIQAVAAYNIKKRRYHPKEKGFLGYILTTNGIRIYHAGDTERIPEMKTFSCDIALTPLGQTYTMNSVKEATQAVLDVKARAAIPIHYGMYEGTPEDAQQFKKMLKDKVNVYILDNRNISIDK